MRWPEFRTHFISTFLATWAANNYADACIRSEHKRLETPPCEDAAHLAEAAWKELKETGISKQFPGPDRGGGVVPPWPDSHYLGR